MNLLEIENPSFLKELSNKELMSLAQDIRSFLIENVSKTGGHLSSNLGDVELTIAMHYVFSSPEDKLIFDVGHQCYTHKILTGRAKDFVNLRKYNGLTGFINKSESIHDIWESGHSSTSLSAQSGLLVGEDKSRVVSLIGDASIANGVAFEALNYMGANKKKAPIIILNDNKMSISNSVGAVNKVFIRLRSTVFYRKLNSFLTKITPRFMHSFFHKLKRAFKGLILQENMFEDFGFDYLGPFDGNNIGSCIKVLKMVKDWNHPCVIHFITKKGKGYKFAEEDTKGTYHSVPSFDIEKGIEKGNSVTFASVVANHLSQMIENDNYYVISPAMINGSELEILQKNYPHNVIDVGIAEEHATVMASAMVQNHKNVVLMLYSTFAQRSYDFFLNDVARLNVHLIICIDHSDFVGGDGSTHQGIYDISMFSSMPNFQILAPRNGAEVCSMLDYASKQDHPVVIRYPKGKIEKVDSYQVIDRVSWEIVQEGYDLYVLTYSNNIDYVLSSIGGIGVSVGVINARFIKPLDEIMLHSILKENKPILIYENCISNGGLSSLVCQFMISHNYHNKIKVMGLDVNSIVPCGDVESLRKHFHLAKEDIVNEIEILLK